MRYFSAVFTVLLFALFATSASAGNISTVTLKNATNCEWTDNGFKKGTGRTVYTYHKESTGAYTQFSTLSVGKSGEAPVVKCPYDGSMGCVAVGDHKDNITVSGTAYNGSFIIMDIASDCTYPCFDVYKFNPCDEDMGAHLKRRIIGKR